MESPSQKLYTSLIINKKARNYFRADIQFLQSDYRFPRKACSLSIASNRALKFPLPNERAPLR